MNAETAQMRKIQKAATESDDCRIFRNNTGVAWQGRRAIVTLGGEKRSALLDPRPIKFGLCVGSSDLIGWQSVTVTPDMVGKKIAVFVALEVKAGAIVTEGQEKFLQAVRAAGGVGEVVTDTLDTAAALATAAYPPNAK